MTIESEDLAEMPAQFLDVVADAAYAELTEVREILANLRRVQMKAFGQRLRRDRLHAARIELVQAAQVYRQAIGRQLGHLIGSLLPLVRPIHKVQCYHHAPWRT